MIAKSHFCLPRKIHRCAERDEVKVEVEVDTISFMPRQTGSNSCHLDWRLQSVPESNQALDSALLPLSYAPSILVTGCLFVYLLCQAHCKVAPPTPSGCCDVGKIGFKRIIQNKKRLREQNLIFIRSCWVAYVWPKIGSETRDRPDCVACASFFNTVISMGQQSLIREQVFGRFFKSLNLRRRNFLSPDNWKTPRTLRCRGA